MRIELPERLRGSAAKAVLSPLLAKALIEAEPQCQDEYGMPGDDHRPAIYRISRSGLAAIGVETELGQEAAEPDGGGLDPTAGTSPPDCLPAGSTPQVAASSAPRAGSKLADVIALLQRAEGASTEELTAATGWLPHTARAALTGLRKRGTSIERTKRDDGTTVYRTVP